MSSRINQRKQKEDDLKSDNKSFLFIFLFLLPDNADEGIKQLEHSFKITFPNNNVSSK